MIRVQMPEMEINIMKILIFTTRQLCYNSGYYFAHKIGEELEKLGIECDYCEIPEYAIPSTGTDSSEKAPAAQTGDTMHAVPFALAMIISAGVVVIEISRKKKAVR